MQPWPRHVPVEAVAPPTCQRSRVEISKRTAARHHSCMDQRDIDAIVRRALDEDLPDITSEAIFSPDERGRARFLVKADGIIAGLMLAEATFKAIDASTNFQVRVKDGDRVQAGAVVAEVSASGIALLSGERTALNLMQRSSGIPTRTGRDVRPA